MKFIKIYTVILIVTAILRCELSKAQLFEDVTISAGIAMTHNANKMSTGIAVADFDNNGWPDLYYTGYFHNSKLYLIKAMVLL